MPRPAPDRSARPARRSPGRRGALAVAIAAIGVALLAAGCDSSPSAAPGSTTAPGSPTSTVAGADPATTADGGVPDPSTSRPADDPGDPDVPNDPTSTDRSTTPSGVVTGGTTVSQTSTPRPGTPAADVRSVDFAEHTFPSTACAGVIDQPPVGGYRLVDGEVRWGDPVDGAYAVDLDPDRSYGDVNGDGVRDVSLILECTRGSRPIPVGWVYTVEDGRPVPLTGLDLDPDSLPLSGVLDTELAAIRIQGATVATDWVVYLDGDAVCCPTTTATVSWTWDGSELTPGAPVIQRNPANR